MAKSVRTTVSVPEDLYSALASTAEASHVSTAWVIREALRRYLVDQSRGKPVLGTAKPGLDKKHFKGD